MSDKIYLDVSSMGSSRCSFCFFRVILVQKVGLVTTKGFGVIQIRTKCRSTEKEDLDGFLHEGRHQVLPTRLAENIVRGARNHRNVELICLVKVRFFSGVGGLPLGR